MTVRIQTLPAEVVHLIAAGEVIDSLAAVVRELAENALDAGATRITIALWTDQWRIRVADNGSGMELSDLQQAALPHSTSKIFDQQDLWQITSLGFRGEALHSLAQLADLEICSRQEGQEGWRVEYNRQGEPVQAIAAALARGTIVTAANLFGNWLHRRQAVPPIAQQIRLVQRTIQQLALCHPHVTWQVEHQDRSWFNLWAAPSAQAILLQILRDSHPNDLQELRIEPSDTIVGGDLLLGLPDRCHRHRPDWIKVAVNGRIVNAPELEPTILNSLRRTLPRDRYPVCFLHLRLAPSQIDWNRHPAKSEIYLRPLDAIQQQVEQAIAQALRLSGAILPESVYGTRVGQLIKAAETQGAYGHPATGQSADLAEARNLDRPDPLPLQLKAIAQVHNMYILAEHPGGMWLIEQHIAHERVLYEQLCDRWQFVTLESPILLNSLSGAQVEQLQRIGLTIDAFGEQVWAARTVPEALAERDDCPEALLELSLGGDLQSALVATACRTAIRNGTVLTIDFMQTLLNQWQQTHSPRTCPHGRPIYLPLEESSLSRFFRRHWVIGKSHGI